MVLSSLISGQTTVLLLAVTHGICIGLFYVAAINYVQILVPENFRSTGQSLFYMFYTGAGIMLGNLSIGFLNNYLTMKGVMAVHGVMALLVLITGYFIFRKNMGPKE